MLRRMLADMNAAEAAIHTGKGNQKRAAGTALTSVALVVYMLFRDTALALTNRSIETTYLSQMPSVFWRLCLTENWTGV